MQQFASSRPVAGHRGHLEQKFVASPPTAISRGGQFSGYASLFGQPDLAGDVIEPGAFAASLRRRGADGIKLLYQHDPVQPIGAWQSVEEDQRGLYVRGRLLTDVAKAREALALMRGGALDGLSIGFTTVRARKDPTTGHRHLLEVDLWEISLVTFPMLQAARIATVKSGAAARSAGAIMTDQLRRAARLMKPH